MSPGPISEKVVSERSEWIREMLERIRSLPLDSLESFTSDPRNVDAAESCLRRCLEALLDLGRHLLAKAFADAPAEYKAVATRLGERGLLNEEDTAVFVRMAGYRNRMVHFYDRVSAAELFDICAHRQSDIERVMRALHSWLRAHPELLDRAV